MVLFVLLSSLVHMVIPAFSTKDTLRMMCGARINRILASSPLMKNAHFTAAESTSHSGDIEVIVGLTKFSYHPKAAWHGIIGDDLRLYTSQWALENLKISRLYSRCRWKCLYILECLKCWFCAILMVRFVKNRVKNNAYSQIYILYANQSALCTHYSTHCRWKLSKNSLTSFGALRSDLFN